ncbi:MAG: hypothetical protein JF563_04585, partial [Acidobacteriales bacterium]|nr:hypothetical protein [Terriglobales bacterium]
DQNNVQKITQTDDLGRITAVCEISGNSYQGDSPQDCGLDIAGTGYLTTYSYDLANHKTTITQGVQQRVFQTDSLGRTIYTFEPERGVITYSYAYNGTGLQVTRTTPKANQLGSLRTSTVTQYDKVGRPLTVAYDDGTPTKLFAYDQTNAWDISTSQNLGASKGHMTQHYVAAAGNYAAASYGYDAMGRVNWNDQCIPTGCGSATWDKILSYTYDYAGNPKSATNGAGVTTSYSYTTASEVSSITSSLSTPTMPASLVSNVQYGPFGPSSYQLGNGYSQSTTYYPNGQLQGSWVCVGSPSPACSAQTYGFYLQWTGNHLTNVGDNITGQGTVYGYDEFNRLSSANYGNGAKTFSYSYDRYGNRWNQNAPQGGPAPAYAFDKTNVTQENDGSTTAYYYYNALNQRVRVDRAGISREFVYNLAGQRVSIWDGSNHNLVQGQYYWGSMPIAFYSANALHFQHQDWLGTERGRTGYSGTSEGTYSSLPFGDAYTASGSDDDPYHYGGLDHDAFDTYHAQFRQYSSTQGRWMSP